MLEQTIFAVGILFFLFSGILFMCLKKKNEKLASMNMFVSFIAMTSYAVMYSGFGSAISLGMAIYPTRWLFYIASCSILMYEISLLLKKNKVEIKEMLFFNVVVMFTGYMASISTGLSKTIFFLISTASFLMILKIIHSSKKLKPFANKVKWFVTIFWSLFPVFWLLGPTYFGMLTTSTVVLLYLCLDVFTKTIFGYFSVVEN